MFEIHLSLCLGYYVAFNSKGFLIKKGEFIELRSPDLYSPTDFCLRFWYFSDKPDQLRVLLRQPGNSSSREVWRVREKSPDRTWVQAQVDLPSSADGLLQVTSSVFTICYIPTK
jgi:hypothetical protein